MHPCCWGSGRGGRREEFPKKFPKKTFSLPEDRDDTRLRRRRGVTGHVTVVHVSVASGPRGRQLSPLGRTSEGTAVSSGRVSGTRARDTLLV